MLIVGQLFVPRAAFSLTSRRTDCSISAAWFRHQLSESTLQFFPSLECQPSNYPKNPRRQNRPPSYDAILLWTTTRPALKVRGGISARIATFPGRKNTSGRAVAMQKYEAVARPSIMTASQAGKNGNFGCLTVLTKRARLPSHYWPRPKNRLK